jgi:amino acid adenylation domain-containing protein
MQNSTQGFRISPQQRNLWLLQESNPEQSYGVMTAVLLEGEIQPRVFEKALSALVQRHEILRTTFKRPQGVKTPFQVVIDDAHLSWQAIDLSHLDPAHQEHRIKASFNEERVRCFDFERGPLLRITLFRLSPHRRVLTIALPALCADSATLSHFLRELHAGYEAIINEQIQEGEVMQYADFAEWHHELRESEDEHAVAAGSFWSLLNDAGISAPTLPFEKRGLEEPADFDSFPLRINKNLKEQLEKFASARQVSLRVLLFSCWQALLWRLTLEPEFVIFNLSDGRKLDDLVGAFGLYDSYLPVRCQTDDVNFGDLLATSQKSAIEAHEWLEFFDPYSTADHVAFEFTEQFPIVGETLTFSPFDHEAFHQPFKLRLVCTDKGNSVSLDFRYNSRRFERDTIERFAGYLKELLTGLSTARGGVAKSTIGSLEILNTQERRQLVTDFNRTETSFSRDQCIHQLFEAQVERTPHALALVFEEIELSYEALNARANQLARVIRNRGAKPNDRVGLTLPRSADAIIGMMGIMKAGCAYVPLNPEHPKERVAVQLAESGSRILISNAGAIDSELNFHGETIDLVLDREEISACDEANLANVTLPDNLAYVIYTSGSTGIAKGVGIQHRNLVNYTEYIAQLLDSEEPLHFATVSTITADLGNTCIFPSLISGGCLHVLGYETAMEGDLFRAYVAKWPIDVLKIVPSHLQALLASDTEGQLLPSRFLLLGGEALSWELVEKISGLKPLCRVINHYGPTETTIGSLTNPAVRLANVYSLTVPIGKPIANTSAHVLDKYFEPQPFGVPGELFIGGKGVSSGYLNQAAETAAHFVVDPFDMSPGARLYRTGDKVRRHPDGNIEFLGRIDNQIKVRGYRVEPGEIETALLTHPLVQQAAVVGDVEPGGPAASVDRLIAYVVTRGTKAPSADDLRAFLNQYLPDYMIPSVFVSLKTMPLTPNGKVDRRALPKPDETRPDLQRVFVAPRTDTERELSNIWAGLLKVDEVGVHDDFFELGGHSLLATQVVSRMRQIFQIEIPLRGLFESPTVAALAEKIDSTRANETARLLDEIDQLSDEEAERLLRTQAE